MAKIILLLLIFPVAYNTALAQWEEAGLNISFSLPEIALIDIEPDVNNSITFSILPSGESGNSPEISIFSQQTLWLNYSSCLKKNQNSRSVVAELSKDTKQTGIKFYLEASNYTGIGEGQPGMPTGKVELTKHPVSIITGLGNVFTGDGINNGHMLTFSAQITDYNKISSTDQSVFIIIYTLTDN